MRIDRSRISVISRFDQEGAACAGLVVSYGAHQFECWPSSAYTEVCLDAWAKGYFARGSDNEVEVLGWIEEQFVTEELPKLSAHQRIAMIRDGLLIPEVVHPGG